MSTTLRSSSRLRQVSHAGGAVVSQGLSGLSNFLMSVVVARHSTALEFGIFSLVFAAYLLGLSIGRGAVGEPLLMLGKAGGAGTAGVRGAHGYAFALGFPFSGALALASTLLPGTAQFMCLVLAAGMPVLLLQDAFRYDCMARGRYLSAALLDATWVLTFAVGALSIEVGSVSGVIALWIAGATVSVLVGFVHVSVPTLSIDACRGWFRVAKTVAGSLVTANVLALAGTLTFTLVTAVTLDVAGLGLLRKALVPLSLVGLVTAGLTPLILRQPAEGASAKFAARVVSIVAVGMAAAWGTATYFVPVVGATIVGDEWAQVRPFVPMMAVYFAGMGAAAAALAGLAARRRGWQVARIRALLIPLQAVCVALGAVHGGGTGAASGLAAAWLIAALIAWWSLATVRDPAQLVT